MAGGQNRVNVQVGFSVDKSGLSEMQSLFQQIANRAKEPGVQLNQGLKQAATTAGTLDQILEKTFNTNLGTLNVTKFNQELSKSGLTLKQVQSDLTGIGNQGATAYNRLAQAVLGTNLQLKESNKLLDTMAISMANTVKWGITSSIFNNITNAISKAVTYAKQLDTSLNDIRIVTDKSADSMDRFAEKANMAAKQMGASTLDYTNAALIYYQQGLSDEETAARAETTIKAANVTGQTGQEVSEQLTAVWNGYKVTAEETELYVDKLAAVAATTAADLEELSTGMSKVAAAANAMGVDFDDLNAQIATIVSVTRQAPESVGTALKTIYARLGDLKVDGVDEFGISLGEVSAQLQTMGIQILDQNGDLRDMSSVIAEVATKWDTWTRAQQQAAAVAMAGKRQYNNLVALFENWDMYTDVLETSTEAMGTLQHQQDIYMESTAAKLKTLKATWQDMYEGLIDNDEINAGIEGLTNLVQVFDNFIDSFGGGLKSITAFGTIVANIFNKQIADGINNVIRRQNIFKQNLDLARLNADTRSAEIAKLGDSATPQQLAMQVNTKEQLDYAQKIYDARVGLNQEQYNILTNYQKELGALKGELTYITEINEQINKKQVGEENYNAILKEGEEAVFRIQDQYDHQIDTIQKIKNVLNKTISLNTSEAAANSSIEQSKQKMLSLAESLGQAEHKNLQDLLAQYDVVGDLEANEKEINSLLDNQIAKYKVAKQTTEQINNNRVKAVDLEGAIQNTENETKALLEMASNAQTVTQRVITMTSALGSMAMAWSSVNSLMQTWNDKSASFGDKITQIFMTLGFSLPMVFSNIKKLNEVFGVSNTLSVIFSKNKSKELALTNLSNQSKQIENWLLQMEAQKRGVSVDALEADVQASIHDTVAKQAEKVATEQAENAQWRLNAALSANPAGTAILVLTALVAVLAAVKAHYDKVRQAILDTAKATIEENNSRLNEIESNKDLVENYNDLIGSYKAGKISKSELVEETEELCNKYNIENAKVLVLTDNYDALTAAIQRTRKAELDEAAALAKSNLTETERSAKATASNETWTAASSVTDMVEINSLTGEAITGNVSTSEGILEYYNKLIQARDELIDSGKNKTGLARLEKEITEYQEYVDQIISNIEKLGEITAEQGFYDNLNLFNEEDLNYENFVSTYENILKSVKVTLQDELGSGELTQEEYDKALKNAENYLNSLIDSYDHASKLLAEKQNLDFLTEQFKNNRSNVDIETWLKNNIYNTDKGIEISAYLTIDGDETEAELNAALKQATAEYEENQKLERLNSLDFASSALTDSKAKTEDIEEALHAVKDAYGELFDFEEKGRVEQLQLIQQIANQELEGINYNNQQIQKANEERIAELENRKKILENLGKYDEKGFIRTDIVEELNQIEEEIKALTDENYEISIGFNDEVTDQLVSMAKNIVNTTDAIISATEYIGDNFTVAAESVEALANALPEIFEGATVGADGLVQLQEEVVKSVLGSNAEILASDSNVVKQKIKNKIVELDNEISTVNAQLEIAEDLASGKISLDEAEKKAEEENLDGYSKFLEDSYQDWLTNSNLVNGQLANNQAALTASMVDDINQIAAAWANVWAVQQGGANNPVEVTGTSSYAGGDFVNLNHTEIPTGTDKINDFSKAYGEALVESLQSTKESLEQNRADLVASLSRLEAGASDALKHVDRVSSGRAGKEEKSKSGGKDKKDKDDKKLEDEFDRYWEIKKAIDATDRSLKKLDKDQENLYGKELINSLKLENELLDTQAENYRNLAAAQQQEAAELQSVLAGYGVAFDASGAITNYAAATAAALQQYNDAIHQYNMGLIDESTLGVYEKNYEKFKKALERYDQLFYTEMKDTEEKLDEIRRKQLANNLKAWQVEIQLKLDMKDLERQWNDFITKVTKDFQKVYADLRVDLKSMLTDAQSYIGEEGTVNTIINAVHDVTNEIDKMRFGGTSDMFESISQAQEELKDLNDKLLDAGEALHDLWEQAWDNYLDGIDQVADQFDDLIDRFEKINDELAFQGELIELLYGEEAYGLMDKLFKGQEHNTEAQLVSLKQQRDMWEQLFYASGATLDNQAEWNEDQRKYYEEWMEAQTDLNNLVLDYIKLLKDDYLNTVKDVLKQFETFVSGSSLAHLGDQWDRIADRADKYYDSVEGAYEVQKLANEMDESIANTSNLKTQQQLQALRDKEIKYLREKENLTEYDLQAAEARFQIALKQAALDDAQNNKTSMKLTRNEQGNWSYQYIADEDDVMNKRQELLDAYNQLYQLASDAYEANLEALMNLQQTYLDKAQEIYESEVLTEEEKQQQLLELRTWYLEEYKLLAEENTLYRNDLQEGAAALLLEIYNQDQEAYTAMTEAERELLDSLIAAHVDGFLDLEDKLTTNYDNIGDKAKQVMQETRADWTSGAQEIADLWNGDNGFSVKVQVLEAYNTINDASIRYKELVDWCAAAVGRDFSEEGIAGAIMRAEQETDNLSQKTADLVNSSVQYLSQLRAYVDQIADAWRSVQQAIMDAIGLIQEYLRYVGAANAAAENAMASQAAAAQQAAAANARSGGNSGIRGSSGSNSNISPARDLGAANTGYIGNSNEQYRAMNAASQYYNWDAGVSSPSNTSSTWGIHDANQTGSYYNSNSYIDKYPKSVLGGRSVFATGGYTGEWGGTDGRLAVLHQKEIVLNESDTANFLKGINMMRQMTGLNGSIETAIMKSVASMAVGLGNLKAGSVSNTSNRSESSNNTFNISAEFPNANNVDEIRQAILTLPNLASQYANTNLK